MSDELDLLISDCMAIVVEHEFISRWARIEGYHLLGKRIATDELYKRNGSKIFVTVTQQTNIKERNLYRAIQFYEMYPNLDALTEGKNISWHMICNKYLPAPRDKEPEPEMCVCPNCGREHRKMEIE